MGVLSRLVVPGAAAIAGAAVVAGCYAPALRDCTVTCTAASDCASGQVCGKDGLCAGPEIAGRCDDHAPDAALPQDAGEIDTARPDSTATVILRVQVMGKGSIVVDGRGTCSSADPTHGSCMYDITLGVPQRVRAVPIELDELFQGWASPTCMGLGAICTFTPVAATMITAKFGH